VPASPVSAHSRLRRESSYAGAPEDRQDRVVRSLIANRDQLLRYILFLLAGGDEGAASSGELRRLLESPKKGPERGTHNPYVRFGVCDHR
jgi:hypothetical protein